MTFSCHDQPPEPEFWHQKTADALGSMTGGQVISSDIVQDLIHSLRGSEASVPVEAYLDLLARVAVQATQNGNRCFSLSANHFGILAALSEAGDPCQTIEPETLAEVIDLPPFDEQEAAANF